MDDLIVDGAVRSIQKNAGDRRPFFMFVGLMLPHPPYQIEQKYYDLIDKSALPSRIPTIQDGDKKPLMERGLRDALHIDGRLFDDIRVTYLAMCAKVDAQIGLLLQALKTADIYDDTAVMIFSDHGDYTGDFGLAEKSQNCFPDCLTNVPLIIKPAKGTPVDTGINDNLAELVDIAATAAGLTGITIERTHFSRSLLPTLRDKSTPHRAFVSCEGGRNPGETHCSEFENYRPGDHYAPRLELQHLEDGTHGKAVMLRTKTYKYIRRLQEPDEFYDLAQGERQNLIDDPRFAEQIADAKRRLLDWFIETADAVPTRIDSRFSLDLLKNGIRAAKAPAFLGDILGLWLRLTKTTPGQFMAKLQGLAERNKK
jgi:arylsulfatase A-like enzyme